MLIRSIIEVVGDNEDADENVNYVYYGGPLGATLKYRPVLYWLCRYIMMATMIVLILGWKPFGITMKVAMTGDDSDNDNNGKTGKE